MKQQQQLIETTTMKFAVPLLTLGALVLAQSPQHADGFKFGRRLNPFGISMFNDVFGSSSPFGSTDSFFPTSRGANRHTAGLPVAAWVPSRQKDPFDNIFENFNRALAPAKQGSELAVTAPPPARSYDARTDDEGNLLIEVSAPQASGTSFDIEVNDAERTLKIKEHWKRSKSDKSAHGWSRSSSSGAFEKMWRVPATVSLEGVTAEWDSDNSKLVVRMPVDHSQNLLIEHDDSSEPSNALAHGKSDAEAQCDADGDEAAKQAEYEARMQEEYERQLAEYNKRVQEYEQRKKEYEQKQQEQLRKRAEAQKSYEKQLKARRAQQLKEAQERYEQRQEQRRQAQLRQMQSQQQEQQRRELPTCSAGARVKAIYSPNGKFYDAEIEAIDTNSGVVAISWADGDTNANLIPARQQYIRGCKLPERTATQEHDPAPRKIETEEQREAAQQELEESSSGDVDEFEIIEEVYSDDENESLEKDDDASSGYFMFGEFHPY